MEKQNLTDEEMSDEISSVSVSSMRDQIDSRRKQDSFSNSKSEKNLIKKDQRHL